MTPVQVIENLPIFVFLAFTLGLVLRWILGMFGWLDRYF